MNRGRSLLACALLVLPAALVAAGCAASAPPPTTPPPTDPVAEVDGSKRASYEQRCEAVCSNLKGLHCEGNAGGGPNCFIVCARALVTGAFDLHPECQARARTCAEAEACNPPKPR